MARRKCGKSWNWQHEHRGTRQQAFRRRNPLGAGWYMFDLRNHAPRVGSQSSGQSPDAADVAIRNSFGLNCLSSSKERWQRNARSREITMPELLTRDDLRTSLSVGKFL
jgi:hypothetical protein